MKFSEDELQRHCRSKGMFRGLSSLKLSMRDDCQRHDGKCAARNAVFSLDLEGLASRAATRFLGLGLMVHSAVFEVKG
jgi:hypothetical protein